MVGVDLLIVLQVLRAPLILFPLFELVGDLDVFLMDRLKVVRLFGFRKDGRHIHLRLFLAYCDVFLLESDRWDEI